MGCDSRQQRYVARVTISIHAARMGCDDNTNATVTAQDLRNIIAAVAMRSNTLHEQYRVAKEVVNAAETKEEVEAVTLEGNADV